MSDHDPQDPHRNIREQIDAFQQAIYQSLQRFYKITRTPLPPHVEDLQSEVALLRDARDFYKRRVDALEEDATRMVRERDEWRDNAYEEAERAADALRERDVLHATVEILRNDLARMTYRRNEEADRRTDATHQRDDLQDRIDTAIHELTRWHPNRQAALDALARYEPVDEGNLAEQIQMAHRSVSAQWMRYTPDGTVCRITGVRAVGEYDVLDLDGLRWTTSDDDLERWYPYLDERVTGENRTRTGVITGRYAPDYRTQGRPGDCVAVRTRPSVHAWVRLDSLRPAESGYDHD